MLRLPDFQPRFKTMADNLVRIDNILLFNKKPLYHMIMMKDLPELLKIFDFDIKKTAAYMNWHEGRLSALCENPTLARELADDYGSQVLSANGLGRLLQEPVLGRELADECGPQVLSGHGLGRLLQEPVLGRELADEFGPQVLSRHGLGKLLSETDGKRKKFIAHMGVQYANAYFLSHFVDTISLAVFSKVVQAQSFFGPLQLDKLHAVLCSPYGKAVFADMQNDFASIKLAIDKKTVTMKTSLYHNNLAFMEWIIQTGPKKKKTVSQRERVLMQISKRNRKDGSMSKESLVPHNLLVTGAKPQFPTIISSDIAAHVALSG